MAGPNAQNAYENWHTVRPFDAEADAPWHRLLREHLAAGDLAGRRILEIGCGRGGMSCWLAGQPHKPAQIVAADFARSAVEKGREFAEQHALRGILWQVGDIQAIAHPDCSFDTVISCETVEHVPEPRRALGELARVLRHGGRLFLTTPNYFGTMGLYRGYRRLVGRPFAEEDQPINNFTMLPTTIAWVKAAGLRVQEVDAIGHYLPFPGRQPIHLPALDRPRILMRWLALHSIVIARKTL